ncbi:hypothetical protein RFI_11889 [Reticulomyxa filosa]|uniref:Carbohydrate sulfotransferase n=1 Tax=Reticulomyxa filosa TaxID=46433 RepID=X6NFZ0_RETFI|nr:hypothetical protein RFI_11889 [Reticulomyxa filosa]|eukprot:ETO25245.1 hypothetical protein RFI_11889 [Reticulomyxa filosa]
MSSATSRPRPRYSGGRVNRLSANSTLRNVSHCCSCCLSWQTLLLLASLLFNVILINVKCLLFLQVKFPFEIYSTITNQCMLAFGGESLTKDNDRRQGASDQSNGPNMAQMSFGYRRKPQGHQREHKCIPCVKTEEDEEKEKSSNQSTSLVYNEVSNMSPNVRSLSIYENQDNFSGFTITESEVKNWWNNHLFVFPKYKSAFCVIEKNSCTMFKQIFKRIENKGNYLDKDYTKIHWLPYRERKEKREGEITKVSHETNTGLQDISFHKLDGIVKLIENDEYYFAAFVRDPLERMVSGYVDKCEKKRGVNLCDYARWGNQYRAIYGSRWDKRTSPRTPPFQMWVDGLLQCPLVQFDPFLTFEMNEHIYTYQKKKIKKTSSCMDGTYGHLGTIWKKRMEDW